MRDPNDLVCDRCGDDHGTCWHVHEKDYAIEPRWKFNRDMAIFKVCSFGMILSLFLIGGIIAYVRG